MKAKSHAMFCKHIASDLNKQLDVEPVFSKTINNGSTIYVYCHPNDENKVRLSDFEYPHREL